MVNRETDSRSPISLLITTDNSRKKFFMSNQLQQDHYKLTPKEHENSKASPEGEGVEGAQYLTWTRSTDQYKKSFPER